MARPRTKPRATDIKAPLGDRVRELRERRGLTQGQLAKVSEISKVFLGVVERGEKAATVESLEKIARGLQVEVAELFRFGARDRQAEASAADRLGRQVAAMARGLPEAKLGQIESVVRVLVEPEKKDRRTGPRARRR